MNDPRPPDWFTASPSPYREPPPPSRQASDRCAPTDPCAEPGCSKTVADHIAELKAHGLRISQKSPSAR